MRTLTLPPVVLSAFGFWRARRASARHPSRPSAPRKNTKRLVGAVAGPSVLAKLEALQTPVEVEFARATDVEAFQALAWRAFDLILVELAYSGRDLADCLETLRSSGSASARSPVVLLGREGHRSDLVKLDPSLVELVTLCTTPPETLRVVSDTLHLRDRACVHLFAETEMNIDSVRSRRVCQIENISTSGMLLRTKRYLPLGSVLPFSLQLPDGSNPIYGRGEVARYTDTATEAISGMGVRFFGLDGDGSSRLDAFLGLQLD